MTAPATPAPPTADAASTTGSPLTRAARWVREVDRVDLVLRATLLAVVAASHYEPLLMVATAVAAVVLLGQPRLLHHPGVWLAGAAALAAWQLPRWYELDNHVWLTTYWVAAVGLSLTTERRERTLEINGRLLIGLIFLLATAWKLGSPDFRTADFFHYSLLQDDRFGFVAEHVGGIDEVTRQTDREAVRGLAATPEQWVDLGSTSSIETVARVFTVWGALIEGVIALTWLAPLRRRHEWVRHVALLAFVGSTYLVVPVGGFGCLLMAMGLSQTSDRSWVRPAYVVAFGALLLYGPVWQAAFGP